MKGWIILILVFTSACRQPDTNKKGKLLAKVGGAELYESDLRLTFSKKTDSVAIKKQMVNDWVKSQLIYKKAMAGLSSGEKDKDREIKDYYESLIRYSYLEKIAAKNVDTAISGKDIEDYYQNNQKNFELKRNIIRFLYVKVPIEAPINKRVKFWMQHTSKKTMDSLKNYVHKYASNSLLDTAKWYYFSDITKEIPILQDYNPEHFIKSDDYVELKDEQYLYFINIVDGRIKEEIAPLPIVKDKIKTIIINQRKTNKTKEIENQIYREGETQRQFEIY